MTTWNERSNLGVALGGAKDKVSYSWAGFSTGMQSPCNLPNMIKCDPAKGSAVWVRPSPAEMGIPNKSGRYDGTRIRIFVSALGIPLPPESNPEILAVTRISDFAATEYGKTLNKIYNVDTGLLEEMPGEPTEPYEPPIPTNGNGPTPPSNDDFPAKPDSANPIDWIKWLVEVIIWGFKKLSEWIAWGIYSALLFVWEAIPEWIRIGLFDFIKSWFAFWAFMFKLMTKPRETIIEVITGFFIPGSDSIQEVLATSAATEMSRQYSPGQFKNPTIEKFLNIIGLAAEEDYAILQGLVEQGVKVEGVEMVASAFYKKSLEITTNLGMGALMTEWLSLGQVDGTDRLGDKVEEMQGFRAAATEFRTVQAEANLGTIWKYHINKKYPNKFPGTGELISIRRLELIEQEEFEDVLMQQGGISGKWAKLLYASSLEPPTIDDYITFNLRHPDKAKELKEIMAIVNIDAERFGDIFEERKYVDPSITQARFMFEIKAINRDQVFDIVRRNRFNTEALEGQEESDAEIMTNYLTGFQTRIWLRQALLAGRANFIEGYVKEEELKEQAAELLPAEKAIDTYLLASKQKRMNWLADRYIKGFYTAEEINDLFDELGDVIKNKSELMGDLDKRRAQWERERQKLFTSSMLGRLLQDGEITPERLDDEVDLFDLDDERKDILKSWLKKTKTPEESEEPV